MAYSYATTVASGSSPNVTVPFPFIRRNDVHVTLNGVLVDDALLVWQSDGVVRLPSTPANGTAIKVYRDTQKDTLNTVFSTPTLLDPRDLNGIAKQLLYVTQEAFDAEEITSADLAAISDYVNTAMAAANDSAVAAAASAASALSYKDTAVTQASAAATSASAAATSASAAATSASSMTSSVTAAAASAMAAAASATNAASSATSASTQATNAGTQATNAAASATAAAGSATAAASSATAAAGSATTASTQASTATTQATNAATSATNAATSATNAANSATAAAASAAAAAAAVGGATVFIGAWDASAGTFPGGGTAQKGSYYSVSVAGTVDGKLFDVGDQILAIVNNASTTTYASNWIRAQGLVSLADITGALGYTPADQAITISAAGLASGGGSLAANRTITVTAAVGSDVTTGTSTTTAMTPKALADAGNVANGYARLDSGGLLPAARLPTSAIVDNGAQNVNGVKTFGSIPVLPNADPTANNEAARKQYVDGKYTAAVAAIPIPSSTTMPVGWSGLLYMGSGFDVTSGSTVAGSSMYTFVTDQGYVNAVTVGVAQTGTFLNIGPTVNTTYRIGLFVRTA